MSNFKKLSRTEMKSVVGGVVDPNGTCAFSCNGYYGNQTYTKAQAQAEANENVTSGRCTTATWCCSSCP